MKITNETLNTYSTTLDLCPTDEPRNQFVYGSQLYNTFFCVFAVFKTAYADKAKKKIKLISATFNILNYKGPINIGIVAAKYIDGKILLVMRGLSDPDHKPILNFPEDTILEKHDGLTFERVLLKLRTNESQFKYEVFDSEHYIRDGKNSIKRLRLEDRDVKFNNDFFKNNAVRAALRKIDEEIEIGSEGILELSEDDSPIYPEAVSPRCIRSNAVVLF